MSHGFACHRSTIMSKVDQEIIESFDSCIMRIKGDVPKSVFVDVVQRLMENIRADRLDDDYYPARQRLAIKAAKEKEGSRNWSLWIELIEMCDSKHDERVRSEIETGDPHIYQ
jgi:hypothetical protein